MTITISQTEKGFKPEETTIATKASGIKKPPPMPPKTNCIPFDRYADELENLLLVVYQLYSPKAVRYLRLAGASPEEAQDASHEAVLILRRNLISGTLRWSKKRESNETIEAFRQTYIALWPMLELGNSSISTYYIGCTYWNFRAGRRNTLRFKFFDAQMMALKPSPDTPETIALGKESAAKVSTIREILGEKRLAILKAWSDGKSPELIRQQFGMVSISAVKNETLRARKHLRELMSQFGLFPGDLNHLFTCD